MDTNNETEQTNNEIKQPIERIDRGMWWIYAISALVVLIVVGLFLWAYSNRTPMTAQEKMKFNAQATALLQTTGVTLTIALGDAWGVAQDIADFLAHGRIDSPFTVVVLCLTAVYVVRLWTRRGNPSRQQRYTTTQQPQPTLTAPQSQVYFIANHEDATVKIGYSDDPQRRLSDLQMGNHSRLEIVATVPGGQDVEQMLHERFADSRIDGEWFDLSGNLREFIQRVRNG